MDKISDIVLTLIQRLGSAFAHISVNTIKIKTIKFKLIDSNLKPIETIIISRQVNARSMNNDRVHTKVIFLKICCFKAAYEWCLTTFEPYFVNPLQKQAYKGYINNKKLMKKITLH